MSYPAAMRPSIEKVAQRRKDRLNKYEFPRLSPEEKAALLKDYHPDFRDGDKVNLQCGVNKGERVPKVLAEIIESPSRLDLGSIDLSRPDFKTDVLVIGGGGGGVTAALTAHENGAKVILATKLRLGDSNTIMAEGGIAAASLPEDSPAVHYIDTMVGGRFKNIPDVVEALVTEAPSILEWLTSLGACFDRTVDGSYFNHMPAGHSFKRSHSIKDLTGLELMRVLGDEIRNKDIQVLEFSPAIELILDAEGQCVGAILEDLDTGRNIVVEAGAVIMATGGMGRLHPNGFPTSNHYGATADGIVMACRARAKLLYMEYIQYHPTGVAWPEQMLGLLLSEALRAEGAHVVNCDGEPFVNRLETRDALSATILRECGPRGKGVETPTGTMGAWLDTPMIDLMGGKGTFMRRFAGIHHRFKKYGIDPTQEPLLVYPTQHYQNGGVAINVYGQSNVPYLYMAGEVAGGVHGHNRLGANSLVDIFVFGRRAGRHAAENYRQKPVTKLTLDHVRVHKEELEACGISSQRTSPMLLPDYRFEKALISTHYVNEIVEAE
ncbi:MAG TPA: FAD-binding protein [Nitrospirota bacterium]|nr:FAD-binding protein [Nitrospirota bacterium]